MAEQDSIMLKHPDVIVGYGDASPLDIAPGEASSFDHFTSDALNQQYNEHVKRKEEIRQRIENLMREKEFLKGLKPNDVAYMN